MFHLKPIRTNKIVRLSGRMESAKEGKTDVESDKWDRIIWERESVREQDRKYDIGR